MVRKTKEDADKTREEIIKAARRVFHQCGVSRSTLEKIAREAGVTRGAVYWHFKDKAELFFAMRGASLSAIDQADTFLLSESIADPLDAIEQSMLSFFETMACSVEVRETFEIMSLRCEYVDEFAEVLQEVNKPCQDFLAKLKQAYRRAFELGTMRTGLEPEAMALDSVSFVSGLFNNWLSSLPGDERREKAATINSTTIDLRRADRVVARVSGAD